MSAFQSQCLRGQPFGRVWGASGVQGFTGEGYPWHRWARLLGLTFDGVRFVAKTVTLAPRGGNMPLDPVTLAPHERIPRCIVVKPFAGVVLNAVGLSNPGAEALLERGSWSKHTRAFFLSFAAVGGSRTERRAELDGFLTLLDRYRQGFRAPVGLQLNVSCPNVGHAPSAWSDVVAETTEWLAAAGALGIPLVPKLSVLVPVEAAQAISLHPACDALCVSNTIPWGAVPDRINWDRLFGSRTSPLRARGIPADGGLSGAPLLPLVAEWVRQAREVGITKPINAGGGILGPRDVGALISAGADSLSLGSIAILRPWRMRATICRALDLFAALEPEVRDRLGADDPWLREPYSRPASSIA